MQDTLPATRDPGNPAAKASSNLRADSIAVVIPIYRSRTILPGLLSELEAVLLLLRRPFEVVAIDDNSPDESRTNLKGLNEEGPWLTTARLLRNSGQHNAILCGLTSPVTAVF